MACIGLVVPYEKQGQDLNEFPNLERWFETMMERPAAVSGTAIVKEKRERSNLADDKEAQKILFNQRAR
jgi:GST-like protein